MLKFGKISPNTFQLASPSAYNIDHNDHGDFFFKTTDMANRFFNQKYIGSGYKKIFIQEKNVLNFKDV